LGDGGLGGWVGIAKIGERSENILSSSKELIGNCSSVVYVKSQCLGSVTFGPDPEADPDPRICNCDKRIRRRILLFSVTFKTPTKKTFSKFLCVIFSEGPFTSFFKDKKS
jgi:hypothetical protein